MRQTLLLPFNNQVQSLHGATLTVKQYGSRRIIWTEVSPKTLLQRDGQEQERKEGRNRHCFISASHPTADCNCATAQSLEEGERRRGSNSTGASLQGKNCRRHSPQARCAAMREQIPSAWLPEPNRQEKRSS